MFTKMRALFARAVDGNGLHIDRGIMEPVVALNVAGVHTIASCQGHLDHGRAAPWIDIGSAQRDFYEGQLKNLVLAGKRKSKEFHLIQKKLEELHSKEGEKAMSVLNEFYRAHPFEYDRHLILIRVFHGCIRLQSQGAEEQEYRDPHVRAHKLEEYQAEFQALATFIASKSSDEYTRDLSRL